MLDREELAWAAGFFDGEGSTYLNGRYPRSSINQNDPEVLFRFRDAVGLGTVRGPYVRGRGGNPFYNLTFGGWRTTQAVMAILWTWLGSKKRKQYRDVVERSQVLEFTRDADHRRIGGCVRGHPADRMQLRPSGARRCLDCDREQRLRREGGKVESQDRP